MYKKVLLPLKSVKADEKENETKITISVNSTVYENVQLGTECLIGDMDINDVDVKILSVNGHELKNVGTKSGVLDNQGRTVLEFNSFDQGNYEKYIDFLGNERIFYGFWKCAFWYE